MNKLIVITDLNIIDRINKEPYKGNPGISNNSISFIDEKSMKIDTGNYDVIPGNNCYGMPGLIDCHIHLASPLRKDIHECYWEITTLPPVKAIVVLHNAQKALIRGFYASELWWDFTQFP